MGRRHLGKLKCHLDRAIVNEEWHHIFSHTNVEYLKLWGSDHRTVLTNIQSRPHTLKKSFRFDKRWIGKLGFKEAVIQGWTQLNGATNGCIHQKLAACRKNISRWKRILPTNTTRLIKELEDDLDRAQTDDVSTLEEIKDLRRRLCSAFREEEKYWNQKSRVHWYREGDKNTKFFHASTKQRRARNRIVRLQDRDGYWVESAPKIERVATQYFQELFTTSGPRNQETAFRFITEKFYTTTNLSLTKDPSEEEIRESLFDINPDKAPRPDGMTSRLILANYGPRYYQVG